MSSPYEIALGAQFARLHPRLKQYFSEIPEGMVGVGAGTFDIVGTPRLLLWPMLWMLYRQGILFPAWRRGVPFTVLNAPTLDAYGNVAVLGIRTFAFRLGSKVMTDAITSERRGLIDYLGHQRRWVARLSARVVNSELRLESTAVSLRLGRFEVKLPQAVAPVVELIERFDDESGLQQVSVVVSSPRFGRLYEYSGSFAYRVDDAA